MRTRFEVDVTSIVPPGATTLVGDVFTPAPQQLREQPLVAVCLPGGGMSRRYFDLAVAGDPGTYSMARHLTARGMVVVTLDHLGVGESRAPDDPYTL